MLAAILGMRLLVGVKVPLAAALCELLLTIGCSFKLVDPSLLPPCFSLLTILTITRVMLNSHKILTETRTMAVQYMFELSRGHCRLASEIQSSEPNPILN